MKLAILIATACLSGMVASIAKSQEASPATQRRKSAADSKAAKLKTFDSEEWGISFMYPDTYGFKEWNAPVEPNANWDPGRSVDGHPGQVQLATVELPNELFPGTDLRLAIFSLSANRHITREECWKSVSGNERTVSSVDLGGVEFRWSEGGDVPSAAGFKDYAGFANSTCYEIETAYGRNLKQSQVIPCKSTGKSSRDPVVHRGDAVSSRSSRILSFSLGSYRRKRTAGDDRHELFH